MHTANVTSYWCHWNKKKRPADNKWHDSVQLWGYHFVEQRRYQHVGIDLRPIMQIYSYESEYRQVWDGFLVHDTFTLWTFCAVWRRKYIQKEGLYTFQQQTDCSARIYSTKHFYAKCVYVVLKVDYAWRNRQSQQIWFESFKKLQCSLLMYVLWCTSVEQLMITGYHYYLQTMSLFCFTHCTDCSI